MYLIKAEDVAYLIISSKHSWLEFGSLLHWLHKDAT